MRQPGQKLRPVYCAVRQSQQPVEAHSAVMPLSLLRSRSRELGGVKAAFDWWKTPDPKLSYLSPRVAWHIMHQDHVHWSIDTEEHTWA